MGAAQKQISKLQVCYDYVAEPGCVNTILFIIKTNRHHNKMDLKFTDLFSFSSGEESSPHNTSPLKAERLYLH